MTRLFLILASLFSTLTLAQSTLDRSFSEGYLGEKTQSHYAGPWRPVSHHDPYFGRLSLDDEHFSNTYFLNYIWQTAPDWSRFFSEEVMGASTCPHDVLSSNFDDIRYGFRLIALSYLLEILDVARQDMMLIRRGDVCAFDLQALLKTCAPKSSDMKTFIQNLSQQKPYSEPIIGKSHNFVSEQKTWLSRLGGKDSSVSGSRAMLQCRAERGSCQNLTAEAAVSLMARSCAADRELFQKICSEDDQLYGISSSPLSSHLLSTSNLVSLINKEGLAMGCLRRFGQMMASKERVYPVLAGMQPIIFSRLKATYGERYPQGRAFVYGALKEFTQKGLKTIFEPKVEVAQEEPTPAPAPAPAPAVVTAAPAPAPVVEAVAPKPKPKPEVVAEAKTAFLQAAEVRQGQNLERVDVDMLKFRYDYVFSMAELQLLSTTLKDYTSRTALEEMRSWDKLGGKEAPMPLTFLKYLIDVQNHQGLYNVVGVLGEKFWVINDVDAKQTPPEYVELSNDVASGNAWQLYVLRPEE